MLAIKIFKRRAVMNLIAIPVLMILAFPVLAKTINPISLVIDGGRTVNIGESEAVNLFIDRSERGSEKKFWVRVEKNHGTPRSSAEQLSPEQASRTVSIKYFSLDRYSKVLRTMRKIRTYGLVDPYVQDYVICDLPNSFIRYGRKTISMAYNCGANAPDADRATFRAEELLKALRDDTVANPDMKMSTQTDEDESSVSADTACAEGYGPLCNDTPEYTDTPVTIPECNDTPGASASMCVEDSPAPPEVACTEGYGPFCTFTSGTRAR